MSDRDTVFISKATPEDDEFVLWVAPRLERAGYRVFTDILSLEAGDRWRQQVTKTLQDVTTKMLLCCRDATLAKNGVQEEIGIAEDLVKELGDPRFIIPLRLEPFRKVFGIGELQYVNFVGSWATGLSNLLDTLDRQNVVRNVSSTTISPNWEAYRRKLSIKVEHEPENLISNWVRILRLPETIRYYEPTGALNHPAMLQACESWIHPAEVYHRGFFSFAGNGEVSTNMAAAGHFKLRTEIALREFIDNGSKAPNIRPREAKNLIVSMFRQAWVGYCRERSFVEYAYSSNQLGFHAGQNQASLGKKIAWGQQRRSSMLRNVAAGKVWQYGVSATPMLWPFPHFRLKPRVLFAPLSGKEAGPPFPEVEIQHRHRRSLCKAWRNKQWHGRQMAFLKVLSADSETIDLPLSNDCALALDAQPFPFVSPVTTVRPDIMAEDGEEQDSSTLGIPVGGAPDE